MDDVVAVARVERQVARELGQHIRAGTAVDRIVTRARGHDVVAVPPLERVVAFGDEVEARGGVMGAEVVVDDDVCAVAALGPDARPLPAEVRVAQFDADHVMPGAALDFGQGRGRHGGGIVGLERGVPDRLAHRDPVVVRAPVQTRKGLTDQLVVAVTAKGLAGELREFEDVVAGFAEDRHAALGGRQEVEEIPDDFEPVVPDPARDRLARNPVVGHAHGRGIVAVAREQSPADFGEPVGAARHDVIAVAEDQHHRPAALHPVVVGAQIDEADTADRVERRG